MRPHIGVIVDMPDERALVPDVRTCYADDPYDPSDGWAREFARMAEMGLDDEMLARVGHLRKQNPLPSRWSMEQLAVVCFI